MPTRSPPQHHRLAVSRQGIDDGPVAGEGDLAGQARVEHAELVHRRIREHEVDRLREGAKVVEDVRGDVDGVPRRSVGGDHAGERRLRPGREGRHLQAELGASVREEDAGPRRGAQSGDPVALRHAARQQRPQAIRDLVDVAHLDDARLAVGGAVRVVRTRHGRGVRQRRALAGFGVACLPHEQRLVRLERAVGHPHQFPAVADPLDEADQDPRPLVVDVGLEKFRGGHVGLVPGRHQIAEPDAGGFALRDDAEAEAAALRDAGHRAALELRLEAEHPEGRVQARRQVEVALAVRADDPHAAFPGGVEHLPLERDSLLAHLAESRAVDHGERDALASALADRLDDACAAHGHDGDVARPVDRGDGRVAAQARDLGMLRVDRVHAARVAERGQELDRLPADAPQVVRSPDDGDAARIEEQVPAGRLGGHRAAPPPQGSIRTPGFRRPFGSRAFFAARSAWANSSGRWRSYHGRCSRPTEW